MKMPFSRRELLLLALITVVAACLRLYGLDSIPPGLSGDTAYKGVAANRVLAGEHPVFFEESWGGVEPMYMYLLAGFFKLFGSTPLAIKALSALLGILTVPLLYLLVRELLNSSAVALLSATWLAISFWHINYSRLGWEIILAPLFVIVTIYFLWRGLRTRRWREWIYSGLALGASLYTYQALRFLPILVVLYLLLRVLLEKGFWREYGPKAVVCVVTAIVVFLPLGTYFATHSDAFLRRAGEVSIFNPEKNPQGPLYSFVLSTVKVLGTYNVQGDPLWRHNLPGRPAFDVLTSAFFFVGLGLSLLRWRERSYSLLLLWLLVLSLPPILTPPRDVPHFSRSIGALPAACVFPALGMQTAWRWLRERRPSARFRVIAASGLVAVLLASAVLTVRDYFVVWAGYPELREDYFDGQFVDLAAAMNELDEPGAVWLLPISSLASPHDEPGHHTVEFLYRGMAPFYFLNLDESAVATELSTLTRGHDRALLVDYKNYVLENAYDFIDADPKRLAPFLLGKYGREAEQYSFESFDIRAYTLPANADFSVAESPEPLRANFGGQLLLTAADFGVRSAREPGQRVLPSGGEAWVVLQWRALTEPSADYSVAVYLLDQRDRVVGQADKLLLGNNMRATSEWTSGQEEMDYYVLPSLPATPPGEYHIEVSVYDPSTMARLTLQDEAGRVLGQSYTVGPLQIIETGARAAVQPMHSLEGAGLVPELKLLGFDLPVEEANPGDDLAVALYWEAVRDVSRDYVVVLQLRDASGSIWGQEQSRPAYGSYPTTGWKKGEVVRDWHDLLVSPDAPGGEYALYAGLTSDEQPVGELALGTVLISHRARSYEIPPMEHEIGWLLGDGVRLLGYDEDDSARPGGTLTLTLYWQCMAEMTESYTVFTHLLDSDNVVRGQVDRLPASGAAPTTSWLPGEVITDPYEIAVDADSQEGQYAVEVGMYDAATMQRLPVNDAQGVRQGDSVFLTAIEVEAGGR
jgi:4-amino-4-deoxy-L-arabinose transferase-like glycosyltransferase